ncbi:hypothetical protein ST47_g1219 [Ascochyta rabiei]|uniref:Uncharacterized protein n=1 Tax=Didymella rabiei TaxID=5454 RepID=A0A163L5V3_DIDRA|nr:hypothetical protein ST47_g1219 [Ascochyta rabiei]
MNDPTGALPGHYDLQALIVAIGNDDAAGARAMLDQMNPDELKAVTMYAAESFSMHSPLTHPQHVERTILRQRLDELEWVAAQAESEPADSVLVAKVGMKIRLLNETIDELGN